MAGIHNTLIADRSSMAEKASGSTRAHAPLSSIIDSIETIADGITGRLDERFYNE